MTHIPAYYHWCRSGRVNNSNWKNLYFRTSLFLARLSVHVAVIPCLYRLNKLVGCRYFPTVNKDYLLSPGYVDMLQYTDKSSKHKAERSQTFKSPRHRELCLSSRFGCLNQTPPHAACLASAVLFPSSSSSLHPDLKQSRPRPWEVPQVTYLSSMDRHLPPPSSKWLEF